MAVALAGVVPAQGSEEKNKARGQVVQLLLHEGADPNALNADRNHAPLHLALERDLLATVLELTRTGNASLHLKLKDGTSPLHVVANKTTTELADALWGKGVKQPSGSDLDTALHCAAKSGSCAMLNWLMRRGALLTAVNAKQQNILHVAASHNHMQFVEAVRLLAGTQQFLSSVDCDGNTPLHLAAQAGASDVVRWLLTELGGLPSRNRAGQLPRQVAESLGHSAVLRAYDETVVTLKAKDEAVLAQQQGPLGELLLKQHRMIEWQQARLERLEDVIERQQARLEQLSSTPGEKSARLMADESPQAEVKAAVQAYVALTEDTKDASKTAKSVPLATVEAAADKVRQLKANRAPRAEVKVAVEAYAALALRYKET